jgi:3-oxoacyl-[acyl-carrier protein] reductase
MEVVFSNKTAIVTGAAQGIGKVVASSFARTGAKVALLDVKESLLEEAKKELEAKEDRILTYMVDVSSLSQVKKVIEDAFLKWGKIDILVNCAGVVSTKSFVECEEEEWDRVIAINLKGVINTCKVAFPFMINRKYGKIVNIASIAGKVGGGFFGNTAYATSKGGVIALTKGLAREGGPHSINANAVCPGPTNTAMIAGLMGEQREALLRNVPLRRFAEPQDIANAILFLSSDLASYINGEIMDVDGGIMRD